MELHTHLKIVGRGHKGRTCCASAAYRAGQNIRGIDGHLYRYDRKQGVVESWSLFPEHTPEELRSTETLWQAADKAELTAAGEWRKKAQLYRDWNASVPNEFSYRQTKELLNQLITPFVQDGMAVTNAIHDPPLRPGRERNLHVHVMFLEIFDQFLFLPLHGLDAFSLHCGGTCTHVLGRNSIDTTAYK